MHFKRVTFTLRELLNFLKEYANQKRLWEQGDASVAATENARRVGSRRACPVGLGPGQAAAGGRSGLLRSGSAAPPASGDTGLGTRGSSPQGPPSPPVLSDAGSLTGPWKAALTATLAPTQRRPSGATCWGRKWVGASARPPGGSTADTHSAARKCPLLPPNGGSPVWGA